MHQRKADSDTNTILPGGGLSGWAKRGFFEYEE